MQYLELLLTWFCYGWTFITFPGFMVIIAFSLWADYENAKHRKKLGQEMQLLSEDKD